MRCHYEVLSIERDASAKDIKKAFHVQALRWHPDKHQKNNISPEEATLKFQEIQNAYEVLSDAHERKWYDEHREQILRGDDDDVDGASGDEFNLFKYFSTSVYSGFGDDEKSFYSIYGALFSKIDDMDTESAPKSSTARAPVFGNRDSPMDDVNYFYQYWKGYITQRTFAWVDEYKTTDAPTRQVRRAMEKENKKLRDAAKKAFTTEVRELVEFVCRRDPRMIAYQKRKEKEKEERRLEEEAKKREKQAAYDAERLAFQQQEHERWELAQKSAETSRVADQAIEDELEKLRKKLDADVLLCDLCRKSFKSAKQLQNHLTSKKHREKELEIGGVGEYSIFEDELDLELQAELVAMKKAKQSDDLTMATASISLDNQKVTSNDNGSDTNDDVNEEEEEQRKVAEEKKQAAERLRLEKEQKAAEKRKERKEKRKEKKKEDVEKIISKAKQQQQKDQEEVETRKKKGGKKQR